MTFLPLAILAPLRTQTSLKRLEGVIMPKPDIVEVKRVARNANRHYRNCEYSEILSIVWLAIADGKNPYHAVTYYYNKQGASVYNDALAGKIEDTDNLVVGSDALVLRMQGYTVSEVLKKIDIDINEYYSIIRRARNAMCKVSD